MWSGTGPSPGLGSIATLTELDLRGNELHGPVPAYFSSVAWLRLSLTDNNFYYAAPGGDQNEASLATQALVLRCMVATLLEVLPAAP